MNTAIKPKTIVIPPRRLALEVFLFFLFLYLLTANGRVVNRDGEAMFQVARNVAERGRLDVPAESVFEVSMGPRGTGGDSLSFATETAKRGVDGKPYAMYGLGQSLASIPLYFAGKALATALPKVNPDFATRFAVSMLNPLISALTCAVLFVFACSLGLSRRRSLILALIYGSATMAWPYSKSYSSEPLVALMLIIAAYCLRRAGRGEKSFAPTCAQASRLPVSGHLFWLILSGSALGFAVMVRVSSLLLLPVFVAYWLAIVLHGRSRGLPRRQGGTHFTVIAAFLIPICLFLAAVGWYNFVRFGSPIVTGYQSIAWNRPLVDGLYGLLLSPGKGLLWYNPVLVVTLLAYGSFYRWRRREALFIAGLGLVWLVFHAPYRFWEGGWSWGPRLMLPVLPFLLLPAAAAGCRSGFWAGLGSRLLPLVVALGLATQLSAVAVDYTRYLWDTYSTRPDDAYARVIYQPAGSPLVQQWSSLAAVISNAVRAGELDRARDAISAKAGHRAGAGLSEDELSAAVLADTQVAGLDFPDLWPVFLYLFGAPAALVVSTALAILVGVGVMLVVLDRSFRSEGQVVEPEKGGFD